MKNPDPLVSVVLLFLTAIAPLSVRGDDPVEIKLNVARPNVILIMTDDQGYGDLGVTGNPVLQTPHIDRLAGESASLRYFYVSPVCAPTRASLLTGRYNYRTRAIDTWVGRAMMEPGEVTIAELLRAAGYRTGIFGKWHLGDCYPMRPEDQGFDEVLVHRGGGLAQPSEPVENARNYTNPILFRNGKKVRTRGYCTDVYFDAALEFIRKSHEIARPFFAYIPTNAPHSPFHDVPEELYQKYRKFDLARSLDGNRRHADSFARIFAMVENIDENVGRLLAELDSLGIARDTMVLYLHDNGPHLSRYVGDMRGTKTQVYEGGIRSPLFVRWPARLRAGTRSPRVGAHIDIMPTILEATGVSVPRDLRLDGRSLLAVLEGRKTEWPERMIFIQSHRGDRPVRYHHFAARGPRWKLLRASGFGSQTPSDEVPFELYDLAVDPREMRDLASEHPEIIARMKAAYDRWFDDVSSTRPDNFAPPRIIVGNDRETTTTLTRQDWRRLAGPGWGSDGEWRLTFEGEQVYDVQVLVEKPIREARVALQIGELKSELVVSELSASFRFSGLRVSAGDASLRAAIVAGEKTIAPYQVIIERR